MSKRTYNKKAMKMVIEVAGEVTTRNFPANDIERAEDLKVNFHPTADGLTEIMDARVNSLDLDSATVICIMLPDGKKAPTLLVLGVAVLKNVFSHLTGKTYFAVHNQQTSFMISRQAEDPAFEMWVASSSVIGGNLQGIAEDLRNQITNDFEDSAWKEL